MTRKVSLASTKLIGKGATGLGSALDSFAVITACLEYLRVHQEETTKREQIAARRDVLVLAITAERDLITKYFERRFTERREALEQLFAVLNRSVEARDTTLIDRSLSGILGILQDNPLQDLESFRTFWHTSQDLVDL